MTDAGASTSDAANMALTMLKLVWAGTYQIYTEAALQALIMTSGKTMTEVMVEKMCPEALSRTCPTNLKRVVTTTTGAVGMWTGTSCNEDISKW